MAWQMIESLEQRSLLAAGDFSIVVLPDTQFYAESYPKTFLAQTKWVAANAEKLNVRFVTHVGDVVQNGGALSPGGNAREWKLADRAMATLDKTGVPYSVALGNHDYDGVDETQSADSFAQYFGRKRYADQDWYGGSSKDQRNHYQIFSAGKWQFLHVTVEWEAPDAAIKYAQSVINAHPGLPVLLTTHAYLEPDGQRSHAPTTTRGNSGEEIYRKLVRKNPEVVMVFSGHYSGEAHRASSNVAGTRVFELLSDYQSRPQGGEGFLRILKFRPGQNRIDVLTYSPTLKQYERDADSQFSLKFNFRHRLDTPDKPAKSPQRRAQPALKALVAPSSSPFATDAKIGGPSVDDEDRDLLLR